MDRQIPVILVTGFLGSGKTTLLRRMVVAHPQQRLVFLVNEFAESDFDGRQLAEAGARVHSVVGGSLFCQCKAGGFIAAMRDVAQGNLAQGTPAPDAVIIETSGIADPQAIGTLMGSHGLGRDFTVRHIITVVSPNRFLKLLDNLPVTEAQIRGCDLVILNKCDLAGPGTIAAVRQRIRELNTRAALLETSYCGTQLDLLERVGELPCADLSTYEANPFACAKVSPACGIPHARFLHWLESLPGSILRVKGMLRTDAGWFHLEKTVDALDIAETAPPADGRSELVLIAPDEREVILAKYAAELEAPGT